MPRKAQITTSGPEPAGANAFPVAISREELHHDVVVLFLFQARTVGWMTDTATAWSVLGKKTKEGHELFDPDETADDLGVTYTDVQRTAFARAIEAMYDYAYFGLLDESIEPMTVESIYSWTSAILNDMSCSSVMNEWLSYGCDDIKSAARCRRVAELANARAILEGGEGFYYFHGSDDDFTAGLGSLTVRQLALLAGMEEHSIRAAANPKRATPLITHSEEGRTRIAIDIAKAWLIAKGRYVPISRRWSAGEIDLVNRKFTTVEDLHFALEQRCAFLVLRDNNKDELERQLSQVGVSIQWFIVDFH